MRDDNIGGVIAGYDATTLAGRISGVGYYTRRLLEALIAGMPHEAALRLHVLSNRPVPIAASERVEVHTSALLPFRSLWMQIELPRFLRRLRPDVVHFTNYMAPLATDVPYVVSFHDMTLRLFPHLHTVRKRLLTSGLLPRVARRARLVLTPSDSTRDDVVRLLGVDAGRVRVIPYAPPEDFHPAAGPPPSGVRQPYLLHVGALEPRKNLPRALRAFARIAGRFPEATFVMAGPRGWDHGAARRQAARAGLGSRAVFLGYVPEAELPPLYTHATALVYPSLYEGFGLPIVEAMACGAPVLTSLSSSMAEIAAGAAILVDPQNEAALAAAMVALLSDAALRAELREKGLGRAAGYTWRKTADATVQAYREAAGR
jgi:glycosyltransferase involved in cell wall biosynthesis